MRKRQHRAIQGNGAYILYFLRHLLSFWLAPLLFIALLLQPELHRKVEVVAFCSYYFHNTGKAMWRRKATILKMSKTVGSECNACHILLLFGPFHLLPAFLYPHLFSHWFLLADLCLTPSESKLDVILFLAFFFFFLVWWGRWQGKRWWRRPTEIYCTCPSANSAGGKTSGNWIADTCSCYCKIYNLFLQWFYPVTV